MTTHHRTIATGGLAVALLLTAACSSDPSAPVSAADSSAPTSPAQTPASTSTIASTSEPVASAARDASSSTTASRANASATTAAALRDAGWGDNVTVSFTDGYIVVTSDGLPNHERAAEYAVPSGGAGPGAGVPTESTSTAMADPSSAQSYSFKITTNPTKAATVSPANGGTIGVMISGAALFNPYEADGSTVALNSNFTVKNASGQDVAFLDDCNGHPNPMGAYHYHGLPSCVTASVDEAGGPSHIIGVAFDGFLIYGDRDIDGNAVTADQLDECNGITSPTPEFPEGIYHYVLLDTPDASSSIRCFSGTVDPSLTRRGPGTMGGMRH